MAIDVRPKGDTTEVEDQRDLRRLYQRCPRSQKGASRRRKDALTQLKLKSAIHQGITRATMPANAFYVAGERKVHTLDFVAISDIQAQLHVCGSASIFWSSETPTATEASDTFDTLTGARRKDCTVFVRRVHLLGPILYSALASVS